MNSLDKLIQALKSIDNVYIISHMYPDGDALGSAFVLGHVLQKMGKKAAVKIAKDMPEKFKFMENYVIPQEFEPDYIVSVDLASSSLVHPSLEKYASKIDLCIDHHVSNRGFAPINYVDAEAAATAEIIYDIIKALNIPLDNEIVEGLYIGISSDTGCFKYSNTTYRSHQIASELMKFGLNTSAINEKLFTVKSKKQLQLEKILYKNLEYLFGGKCAITFVTLDEMAENGITEEECDGIASLPIKIEGVRIGLTMREKAPGSYKVSIRTTGNNNATKLASVFGGGGHFKASGFSIEGPLEEIKSRISNAVKNQTGW